MAINKSFADANDIDLSGSVETTGGFQWDDGFESHEAPEFLTQILMISVYIGIISHKHDCIFVYDFCSFFVRPLIFW